MAVSRAQAAAHDVKPPCEQEGNSERQEQQQYPDAAAASTCSSAMSTIVNNCPRACARWPPQRTARDCGTARSGNLTRTCCSCRASRPGGPGPSRETAHCADAPQSCHLRPRPPLLNLPLPVAIRRDALPLECCRMAPRLSRCSGRGWHRVSRASHNTFKHNTQKRVVATCPQRPCACAPGSSPAPASRGARRPRLHQACRPAPDRSANRVKATAVRALARGGRREAGGGRACAPSRRTTCASRSGR